MNINLIRKHQWYYMIAHVTRTVCCQVKAFSSAYDFKNLIFINEERDSNPPVDATEAFVEVTLERKVASVFKYDFIEEKQRFRKNPLNGVWSVVSSDMKIKPANEKMPSPKK